VKNLFNIVALVALWGGCLLLMGITMRIMWIIFMTGWSML
jgi:hypothetical protein